MMSETLRLSGYASSSDHQMTPLSPGDSAYHPTFDPSGSEPTNANEHRVKRLREISNMSGGFVIIDSASGFVPSLLGSDGRFVPVYDLFSVMEGYLDFDGFRSEFPTISDSQIIAALSFVEKLMLLLSDQDDQQADLISSEGETEFYEQIRNALLNREESPSVFSDDFPRT